MKRRNRLNIALALFVVLAGAFIAFGPGSGQAPPPATLLAAPAADVAVMRVMRPGVVPLVFKRDGKAWFMEAPLRVPANPRRMADLLAVPALPIAATLDPGRESWPALGLSPPLATLQLDDAVIEFGGTEALNGRRYVMQGNRVHLVTERVFGQLLQGPDFFIDPHLLRTGIRPVRIATPHRAIEFESGNWRTVSGPATPAAAHMAAAWETAEANSVHAGVDEATGPLVTVALDGGGAIVFEYVAAGAQPELRRRDLELRYVLDATLVGELGLADPVTEATAVIGAAR